MTFISWVVLISTTIVFSGLGYIIWMLDTKYKEQLEENKNLRKNCYDLEARFQEKNNQFVAQCALRKEQEEKASKISERLSKETVKRRGLVACAEKHVRSMTDICQFHLSKIQNLDKEV